MCWGACFGRGGLGDLVGPATYIILPGATQEPYGTITVLNEPFDVDRKTPDNGRRRPVNPNMSYVLT